jgi:D-glycero-beta-D-manno-heptose-7-phosphate kinase
MVLRLLCQMKINQIKITKDRVQKLIDNFPQLQVMIIGDLMVDKYIWGNCIRLSTEAPIPVIRVVREDYALGGSGNIAFHVTNLGATAHLCGLVGYDDAAFHLRTRIARSNINATGIFPSSHRPTTQKIRILSIDHSHLMGRFDYETSEILSSDEEATLTRFIETFIDEIDVMILSDYDKGIFKSESFIQQLQSIKSKSKCLTIAQSRANQIDKFEWVDHILISAKHASHVLNLKSKKEISGIKQLGKAILSGFSFKSFTIYDSTEQNMGLFKTDGEAFLYHQDHVQLIDQTGSGDVVLSILALGLASGASFEESLILAHRGFVAGGLQVGTGRIYAESLLMG